MSSDTFICELCDEEEDWGEGEDTGEGLCCAECCAKLIECDGCGALYERESLTSQFDGECDGYPYRFRFCHECELEEDQAEAVDEAWLLRMEAETAALKARVATRDAVRALSWNHSLARIGEYLGVSKQAVAKILEGTRPQS